MAEEMFKTTLMGGFDKDDVQEKVQKMKDETAQQQLAFKKEIEEKEQRIAELQKRLELKEANQERLEREIQEKYQKYVDNYETIGRVALEAQLRADKMIEETQEKCDKMVADAEAEAKQKIADAELEIDGKLLDGKKNYLALQEEMSQIVDLINSAQKHFADSYSEVHKIIDAMPTSFAEMEGVESELLPETEKEGAEVEAEVETETEAETEDAETEETQEIEPLDEEDEDLDALDDLDESLDDLELTPLEEEEEEENSEALDEDEKIALQISKLLNQEDQYIMENEEE